MYVKLRKDEEEKVDDVEDEGISRSSSIADDESTVRGLGCLMRVLVFV